MSTPRLLTVEPEPAAPRALQWSLVAAITGIFGLVLIRPDLAGALAAQAGSTTESAMTVWKAALLGIIEGVTEYLPISSTGHLLVASDLLGLGTSDADVAAAKTYAIAIQFGAILAVAGLFWKRFRDMLLGLVGRSESGRHLLIVLIIAFAPAAVLGFLFDDKIESALFSPWPIIAAWLIGGIGILALEHFGMIPRRADVPADGKDPLTQITYRQALVIGLVQTIAMWPGTSRSLMAILGALLVGVGMTAAVEFSFLLGFLTLSAASFYAVLTDGGALVDQFGIVDPLVGLLFAFVSAVLAIRWMVGYLQQHSLSIFGWYRIVAAALAASLLVAGVLNA